MTVMTRISCSVKSSTQEMQESGKICDIYDYFLYERLSHLTPIEHAPNFLCLSHLLPIAAILIRLFILGRACT